MISLDSDFLGIYQENIFVGKIRRQFINENILLIFIFVFINFLIYSDVRI
jgi:hypothetical protein